ncbi:hypothetical protein [Vibrio parahaemolyticus]|nr:hypothetical protein [Vibrio cholerae]EKF9234438.1 hypothetical protein [Vibrio cholerae]HCJ6893373.1 hypothetical protein [Vibrio cholerae]
MIHHDFSSKKATLLAVLLTLPLLIGLLIALQILPKPVINALPAPLSTLVTQQVEQIIPEVSEPETQELVEPISDDSSQPLDFTAQAKQSSNDIAEVALENLSGSLALASTDNGDMGDNQITVEGDLDAPMLRLNIVPYSHQMLARLSSEGVAAVILDTSQGWYSAILTSGGHVTKVVPANTNLSKRSVDIPKALSAEVESQFDRVIGYYDVRWIKLVFTQQFDHRLHQFSLAHPEAKMINLYFKDNELVLEADQ